MKLFEFSPIIDISIIAICCYVMYRLFSWTKKIERFNNSFKQYIKENHNELKIFKEFGPLCFVVNNGSKYILDSRKCYRQYKKNPQKFSDIIEAYLFEVVFVEKVSINLHLKRTENAQPVAQAEANPYRDLRRLAYR